MARNSAAGSSVRMKLVKNDVPELIVSVEARSEELVVRTRELIAEEAKLKAPVGSEAEGDPHPGMLRDSIGVDGDRVIATAPHANFVEHGTVFTRAQPFFAPAVEKGRAYLRAGLKKLI